MMMMPDGLSHTRAAGQHLRKHTLTPIFSRRLPLGLRTFVQEQDGAFVFVGTTLFQQQ